MLDDEETLDEPRLPDLDDEAELARRLREALWPGEDRGSDPRMPRDRDLRPQEGLK